jgi:uncharacterized membrane protein (UPF0127 family)
VSGLRVERTGALVAGHVERADTWRRRLRGLLGRDALPPGHALWLIPCAGVHTFFMRFAIDVLFLDRDCAVVRAVPGLVPWRATRVYPRAHSTLELPAGALSGLDLRVGDRLVPAEPATA